ncbi:MAG: penicillin-insensitive murein endopeptidase [Deltaproteobacteria bacterium]|nr:penicillin-insensitive murein endopeptidase [Deltaproteobacteria bacterium]
MLGSGCAHDGEQRLAREPASLTGIDSPGVVSAAIELASAELTSPTDSWALGSTAALAALEGSPARAEQLAEGSGPHAAEVLSDEEIARRVAEDLSSLGAMSLGRPNAGAVINAVQMPAGDHWELVTPWRAWATPETVAFLIAAIERVNAEYSPTHPLYIGHLSREHGGPLRPHRSHQSGRDVDTSYYYRMDRNPGWYQRGSAHTLDLARTWALVRALVTETDVEYLFIDRSIQRLLKKHALKVGEDRGWLDRIFQIGSREPEPIIRHAWGHATHIHVRFHNPRAQLLAVRAYDALLAQKLIGSKFGYARYRAKGGETLDALAKRYGTTPEIIARANGLRTTKLTAGRSYSIPYRGRVRRVAEVTVPSRRQPPDPGGASRSRSVAAPEGGGR